MSSNFQFVPVLDYSLLSDPATRSTFIDQLRHALINVGFLYLKNPPVTDETFDSLLSYIPRLFALPQEEKDALAMTNSPHFLGYSKLGVERTRGASDQREQFDFATPLECEWQPGQPEHLRLWGPSQVGDIIDLYSAFYSLEYPQWPKEESLPGFQELLNKYLTQVAALSYEFIGLVAEALGLPRDGLDQFYDAHEKMQHRSKVSKLYDSVTLWYVH